jgi:methionine-rich copper-binding protein CopC
MPSPTPVTVRRVALAIVVLLAVSLLAGSLFTQSLFAQSGPTTVRRDVHHDVSQPLSEMIKHAPPPSLERKEVEPMRLIPLPPGLAEPQEDPVIQVGTVEPPTPPTTLSFEGLGNGQYGFSVTSAPPDTEGTVGATQYVQWVNTSFAVFNKSTGALIAGPTAGNTMWSGFGGGCQTNNDGDPIVLYDKLAQRWIFSQFSVSTTPYLQCIAVSTTSDATGTYNRYSFQYTNFDDYPKMSVWSDAYYETFNMFAGGTTFVGADACAYNRAAMMAGTAATQVCFQQGTSVGGLLPSDIDGTTAPPAGSPNYLMYYGTNVLNLYKFHVDFVTTSNSTFTGPTAINVAAFSPVCGGGTCIPQPSTTQQLDSLADRLMYRLAYRNFGTHESLVVSHSVVAGSGGGVRWYEIQNPSGTPTVAQQSTFAPDSNYRWMPSVAMDQAGDLAVGYSVSSSSVSPSVRFAGRVPTDPVSTLETEVNVISGSGSQSGNSLTRWGDYSAMQVDPVDDCTFWYTQEYMKTTGSFNWNTRIANFKFPGCGSTSTPDFSIGASPSSVTVTQGSNGTSTVTITSLNGFNSATTLSATGLPSGVTAAFSPNPVTPAANGSVPSTLTLTASSTATTGTATVTVTGTSGSTVHSTTISLTVNATAQPNFTIGASPSSVTVTQGGNGTSTITVTSQNSFSSATTLSATGLPSGVTAAFSTNPVTPPANGSATSTLTLTASATATTGAATVTVTGTSGTLTHTATIALTVNSSVGTQTAVYDTTLKAPKCVNAASGCDSGPSLLLGRDTLAGGSEPNQPNTINSSCADGTSGTFHSDESNDRLMVATTDGSTMAAGKSVKVSATVWAYSSFTSDNLDLYYTANASTPTWVLIGTITPTVAGAQTLSATYTLPSGTLQAVRAQFRYQGSASSCTTGSYNDHDDLIFAVGAGTPSFTVAAAPTAVTVTQGSTAPSTITVTSQNGFNSATTLSVSGLPTGVTAAFSPNPVTPPANGSATSTLTFTASSTATTGTSTVTVTGTSGTTTATANITLTVSSSSSAQTAVFDSTLKAPKCATVGSSCDSGATLLLGKDTMSGGAEPNQPNNINAACADGTSGTFHSDESNDRIVVTSTGGGSLTHGQTVTVTATVWAWNTGSSDALDLYYTANANSPSWVFIGTIVPSAGGAQALSATYTLPTGALQAVRANFRYQGSASSCSTGAYDDHDDLIFAVN